MDGIDFITPLSNALQLPPYTLIIIISLGFSGLFTFFFKKKLWSKFKETEKFFLSLIIGIITYFIISYILFSFYGFWVFLIYKLSVNIFNDVLVFCAIIITSLWILYLGKHDVEKSTGILLDFLMIFIILIIFLHITLLLSSLFTSYKFLFGYLVTNTGLFMFFGIYPIYFFRKKIKPKRFIFIRSLQEKYKPILIIAIISFFIIFLSFTFFLFPNVITGNKINKFYLFDGNGYDIEYLNYNPNLWLSYKYVVIPIKLENSGIFGWIPINYGNLITDDEKISYGDVLSISIGINESTYHFSPKNPGEFYLKDVGIKNITLEKSYNSIIIIFDKFNFLNLKNIKSINISGWEVNNLNLFSIKEGDPDVKKKGITLYINFTNNLDAESNFQDIRISKYANYKNQWNECNISYIRGWGDGNILTDLTFKNGNMEGGLAKIEPAFYFDGSKNLVLERLTIEKNSTYSMFVNLVCE